MREMKRMLGKVMIVALAVTALSGTTGAAGTAFAADNGSSMESKSTIVVNGSAKIKVKPDIAYISIGVETKEKDAAISQSKNKEQMDDVIKSIKALGIKNDDIATENYSVYRSYDYIKNNQVQYFMTSNSIKITITDFTKIGKVVDAAAAAGANNVNSIRFELKEDTDIYNKALATALQSALKKGDMLGRAMGKGTYKNFKISEQSVSDAVYRDNYATGNMEMKAAQAAPTPIIAGDITVNATVGVELEY